MITTEAVLTQTEEGETVFAKLRSPRQPSSRQILSDDSAMQRTHARTTFYARNAERPNQNHYERLWQYQHRWDADNSGRRTFNDKIAVTEALASSLSVSMYEQNKAVEFVSTHDGTHFNQNGGIVGMALGALAAIRDEVLSASARTTDVFEQRLVSKSQFEMICEKHNVDGWKACKHAKKMQRETR
jgi:hypothetical protein